MHQGFTLTATSGGMDIGAAEAVFRRTRVAHVEAGTYSIAGAAAYLIPPVVNYSCAGGRGDFECMGGEAAMHVSPIWPDPSDVLYGVKYGMTGHWKTGTNRNMGRRR